MKKIVVASSFVLLTVASAVSYAANSNAYANNGYYYNSGADDGVRAGKSVQGRQMYVSGMIGGNALQDQYWANTKFALGSTFQYDFGANVGVSAGIKFNNWRTELNLLYAQNKINSIDGIIASSGSSGIYMSMLGVMVNAIHDFHPRNSKWVPYMGLGIGVLSFDFNDDDNNVIQGSNANAFAYQSILGLGYQMTKSVRVYGEFRHIGSSTVTEEFALPAGGTTDFDTYYQNNLFDVGMSFFFDF